MLTTAIKFIAALFSADVQRIARHTVIAFAVLAAGCAPTFHLDSPAISADEPAAQACTPVERPMPITIAPLDPRPQLPDVPARIDGSIEACPPGTALTRCFTGDEDQVRQSRFKILHDDDEYCRDAYDIR